jgi:hypothetical protein
MQGRRGLFAGAVLIAALAAVPSGTAFADDPPPLVCQGGLFTDPSGDAVDSSAHVVTFGGAAAPANSLGTLPGQDNEDITGATISSTDGVATVSIAFKNMAKTLPKDATGLAWYFGYAINGGSSHVWVGAETNGTDYTFSQGTITVTGGNTLYNTAGPASGTVTEGPNGKISIELPNVSGGDEISSTWAEADQELGATVPSVGTFSSLPRADTAPNAGGNTGTNAGDFVVDGCAPQTT